MAKKTTRVRRALIPELKKGAVASLNARSQCSEGQYGRRRLRAAQRSRRLVDG